MILSPINAPCSHIDARLDKQISIQKKTILFFTSIFKTSAVFNMSSGNSSLWTMRRFSYVEVPLNSQMHSEVFFKNLFFYLCSAWPFP
jgi:hypothetical protein